MLPAASDWIRHLIVTILLATVLEWVLPSGAMQRVTRMVLGLVVTLMLLSPLRAFMLAHGNYNQFLATWFGPTLTAQAMGNSTSSSYANELAHTLKEDLSLGLSVNVQDVVVVTGNQVDNSSQITGVRVLLGPSSSPKQTAAMVTQQIATQLGLNPSAVQVIQG
ncbi:stage III sporulation protein AF [Ferroacidibacillus organovorans]|uniref:Stage III sporulation protein AF n=1 Tax=Ferroacidibacillus organovorans TaxID=1765683 RepID=A0A162TAK2_9BACL|nr:stage III sporulation protein AF [Ferroacidibacillus organovorans]KYP80614.1 hypothetical protein AYJ22_10560 [Ferroacidibacillus organovorans]KYP81031.1 hypothetical protein AYJ22_09285 [Ferroacidibacillus organovorans]OAG94300.1 hypothetical protein AYW79_06095 [Ferroacidibacillus organovorans]OPG16460.1 hypothetical protein B2M26_06165 [Ferroacidibacillus organovorans]